MVGDPGGSMNMAADSGRTFSAEKAAYWYFRLNGFFQIENFVVHPARKGSQLTDADLLAVRFPFRAERLFDDPTDTMDDDVKTLALSTQAVDFVIAEVKSNQPCTLNGPWTSQDKQNVHRVLAAIGCLPPNAIGQAAADIYKSGMFQPNSGFRIRLIAVGRERSEDIARQYPDVTQVTWVEVFSFIWKRFDRYDKQKTQVDQWDEAGKNIKWFADRNDESEFIKIALHQIGVR